MQNGYKKKCQENEKTETRKKYIQKVLQLGLIVDQTKTTFGRINDGNTARLFFKNSLFPHL